MTLQLIREGIGHKPFNNVNFVAHAALLIGSIETSYLLTSGLMEKDIGKIYMIGSAILLQQWVVRVKDTHNCPQFVAIAKASFSILATGVTWICYKSLNK